MRFVRPDWRGRVQSVYERRNKSRKAAEKWSRLISDSELIDPGCIVSIAPDDQEPAVVAARMLDLGAQGRCQVVSESPDLDDWRGPLTDAMQLVLGGGFGSIVVDESGSLAFYEGEGPSDRYLLRLPSNTAG